MLTAAATLAVALVAGGTFAVLQIGAVRQLLPWHTGSQNHARATISVAAPSPAAAAPSLPPGCPDTAALVHSLSTRDKLAQLLMVGVTDADDARRVIAEQHVGGIFIGSYTNLSMLTDGSLTAIGASAEPLGLAVSVDEEGGRVQRLRSIMKPAPSARVLAQTDTPDEVYQLALARGRQMRGFGITIDFAPVVDITDAPDDTVIGDRSFGDIPAEVTRFAGAYAKGLRDAGVLPVLKHFPGHGRASGDSHQNGVTTPPFSALKDLDLVPYQTLVTQTPVGVMIGHMRVPGLTETDQASLSPEVVALLRNGTGYGGPPFDGPIFTDDLSTMKAITDQYMVSDAVLKALQAGEDVALWMSTTQVPAVLNKLEQAVAAQELSITSIEASAQRMAKAKAAFNSHCGG
ncbi:glycoside hydrolase family 3 N-terminal domain-containing protein [Mycobacterium florentinum]|uniref:glycoside hydrolase family 3 N-terminal domain-containing protein n=1 Tax=Mycobacterium florentinum TaxID=292462 RepID=UPI000A166693|nr:glycoside hydrolase family 3 N-terminal domain-containing protein [Mycobacterium florentinum]MCV7409476.1 glycoside hydrolase family 3 protein [Mycobacterium florentinum]BBX78640.1 glycosyl hydrolase [Mycobacterium florentinum]